MKYPLVQLSQFKTPVIGRGRSYSVDFGIAKPLYRQLLSKLVGARSVRLSKPPTNDLLGTDIRIRGRFLVSGILNSLTQIRTLGWTHARSNKAFKSLAWGLVALYALAFLSFLPSNKIIYADPIIPLSRPQPLAMLTMPSDKPIELVPYVVTALADNLPNLYTWGNCTAFVASKLPVPSNWGNANEWAANAAAQGYTVSDTPKVGAIAQTSGDSYLGHVAIVTAVSDDGTFTVAEENYYGLGVTDERITTTSEFQSFIFI